MYLSKTFINILTMKNITIIRQLLKLQKKFEKFGCNKPENPYRTAFENAVKRVEANVPANQ